MKPDLSMVVINWNTRELTLGCLRSAVETRGRLTLELIVVDNASSDGSAEAIAREFPEARLIRNANNKGFARANNQGIEIASGRHVALVNSDVVVLPGCLEAMVDWLDGHPETGLVAPRILNADGTLQPNCLRFPSYLNLFSETFALSRLGLRPLAGRRMQEWAHDCTREVDIAVGCFWVARAEALREVGGLDEDFFMYGEDADWCRRFHGAGWRVVLHPAGQAIHFGGASSDAQPARFFVEMRKSSLRYWRKHHGRLGAACCAGAIALHALVRLPPMAALYLLAPSRRPEAALKLRRGTLCLAWLARLPISARTAKA